MNRLHGVRRSTSAAVALLVLSGCAASPKQLTLDAILGPDPVQFSGPTRPMRTWVGDAAYRERRGSSTVRIDVTSGLEQPDPDFEALKSALDAHPDFEPTDAASEAASPACRTKDGGVVLVDGAKGLFVWRRGEGGVRKLADADKSRKIVTLSPRGRWVSYVKGENIYAIDAVTGGRPIALTTDGNSTRLNGILDWIYQEEIYGRGDYRAHWWSDDDAYLAFLQLDESKVPIYTILDEVPPHPNLETLHYPKPGDPNPVVKLGILRLPAGSALATSGPTSAPASGPSTPIGAPTWVDLSGYQADEPLVVWVSWSPDQKLIYQVQNREQTWLDLNEVDPASNRGRRLLRETSPAWVNRLIEPQWLPDGSFV